MSKKSTQKKTYENDVREWVRYQKARIADILADAKADDAKARRCRQMAKLLRAEAAASLASLTSVERRSK